MDRNRWLIGLSVNPGTRFWKVPFSQLTDAEKIFASIWELEAEVNNGGFSQYYFNSAGDNSPFASAALREIGAHEMSRIVEEANLAFGPAGPSPSQEMRQQILETLGSGAEEKWAQLDARFIAYPDNLTELLYAYIQAHKSQIVGL